MAHCRHHSRGRGELPRLRGFHGFLAASRRGQLQPEPVELYDLGSAPGTMSRLANVSTRAIAGVGDDTIIAGFVLEGAATPVLLRAAGPALVDFGVANFQRDPQLTLFAEDATLATNDQWSLASDSAQIATVGAQLGAFPLRAGSNDAALRASLTARAYTAHATPALGAVLGGSLLIEVYAR